MKVILLFVLILNAVPAGAICECFTVCECEPHCRCIAESAPEWYADMYEACTYGDTERVQELLAAGVEPGKYRSLLRAAGGMGAVRIVELLLPYYTDLPAATVAEYRACMAAYGGNAAELKRLLAAGVSPNAAFPCHETSAPMALLYLAVCGLHTECVELLLAQPGIDVNMRGGAHATPLHMAVSRNSPDMVRLLLAAPGIEVNATDSWAMSGSKTALHTAASLGHTECLRLLLSAPGINTLARDRRGKTALQHATDAGHTDCVELLHKRQNRSL